MAQNMGFYRKTGLKRGPKRGPKRGHFEALLDPPEGHSRPHLARFESFLLEMGYSGASQEGSKRALFDPFLDPFLDPKYGPKYGVLP